MGQELVHSTTFKGPRSRQEKPTCSLRTSRTLCNRPDVQAAALPSWYTISPTGLDANQSRTTSLQSAISFASPVTVDRAYPDIWLTSKHICARVSEPNACSTRPYDTGVL